MNRRALLIAASPESSPIPGVYEDISAWYSFLCSYPGGCWLLEEIITAEHFSRKEVLAAVKSIGNADYSLIVFAGHGQTVATELPWPETELFLATNESIMERELNPGTPRCTLILDCCRRSPELEESVELVKRASMLKSTQDPVLSRVRYDQALNNAEGGLVTIYSTEVGTAAADKHSFSQHIIHEADKWVEQNKGPLSLQEAVSLAAMAIGETNPQQKPEYNGGRRLHHFPLAISI